MIRILLLDGHTVQSISVARSLKESGYRVSAFISERISYGRVCRYIDDHIIAPPVADSINYLQFMQDYLILNKIDVIIPMYDDSAELLSRNKEILERKYGVRCAVTEYSIFSQAHNKQKLMEVCRRYGFPHPATEKLSEENIESAAAYVGFPAIIKPNISAGARGIVLVHSIEDIRAKYPTIHQAFGECTLQHYINHSGVYYNVMLYRSTDGQIFGQTILKIMRYFPIKGGTSCYCETILHDQLIKICSAVLDALKWEGFADFDIMEEKETGDLKIIEINPRIPASIHGAYVSGVNFPEIIVRDILGLPIQSSLYSPGKSLRFMGLDFMWFLFSPKRFSFRPSWFKFWGRNIFYQDGSMKDSLPMIIGCVSGILKYLRPEFRKSKLES